MESFDDELSRRKQERSSAAAQAISAADAKLKKMKDMAAFELESTQEIREWATRKLNEKALSRAESHELVVNIVVKKTRFGREQTTFDRETVRAWIVKEQRVVDSESGKNEYRAVYLLTDGRMAVTGPAQHFKIIETADQWHAQTTGYGMSPNSYGYPDPYGYPDYASAYGWFRISTEDFMRMVEGYL